MNHQPQFLSLAMCPECNEPLYIQFASGTESFFGELRTDLEILERYEGPNSEGTEEGMLYVVCEGDDSPEGGHRYQATWLEGEWSEP